MDKPLTLITGTSKGIGKALKEYYVNKGHIVIGCSRNHVKESDSYKHFAIDITNEQSVLEMFGIIKKQFGHIDNLVNNAGIIATSPALLTSLENFDDVFNVNLKGTFLMSREAAKLMKKKKYGRIVNFTTIAVPLKQAGEIVYASSKSAVEMITTILSKELFIYGITVNAVGPSLTETEMTEHFNETQIQNVLSSLTVNKYSSFEDIFNVVDFYINKKSSMVTGQKIYLGGIN